VLLFFQIAPREVTTINQHSSFWGLKKWETIERHTEQDSPDEAFDTALKDFIKFKALKKFCELGIICNFNPVTSLADVDDSLQICSGQ